MLKKPFPPLPWGYATSFIQYPGSAFMKFDKLVASEQKMESLMAKALRTDLNTSIHLSMKAVSSLMNSNNDSYSLYELRRQVKGIAVRIACYQMIHDLILCLGILSGRVELYQIPKYTNACSHYE